MPGHDIIVIGASAGGVEALAQLVRKFTTRFTSSHLCCPARSGSRYECFTQYFEPSDQKTA